MKHNTILNVYVLLHVLLPAINVCAQENTYMARDRARELEESAIKKTRAAKEGAIGALGGTSVGLLGMYGIGLLDRYGQNIVSKNYLARSWNPATMYFGRAAIRAGLAVATGAGLAHVVYQPYAYLLKKQQIEGELAQKLSAIEEFENKDRKYKRIQQIDRERERKKSILTRQWEKLRNFWQGESSAWN